MKTINHLLSTALVLLAPFFLAIDETFAQGTTVSVPSYEPAPDTLDTFFLAESWTELQPAYSQEESKKTFAVGRFIGKIEERFQTPVPQFWQTTFLDIKSADDPAVYRDKPSRQMARTDAHQLVKGVLAVKKIQIYRDGAFKKVKLTNLIEKFLTDYRAGDLVTVAETKSNYFVAKYRHGFNSYDLCSLDKETGNQKWATLVQPIDGTILYSGPPSLHAAEVHASETNVVIFGTSGSRHYLEAFDPKTGQKTAGFSTCSESQSKTKRGRGASTTLLADPTNAPKITNR